MRFLTKILNHFCRGCGTLLSADERQTGLCSSCWFEKEKKQSLDDKDWRGRNCFESSTRTLRKHPCQTSAT